MLTHRANVLLAGSGALAGADIKVTVNGAEVTLDGVVADRDARDRALSLVRRMRGVHRVVDRLRIHPALSAARVAVADGELAMSVAQALSREFFPDARLAKESRYSWEIDGGEWEIEVSADAGDIILTGEAPTPSVIDELIARARRMRGVRSVRSALSAATFYRPAGDFPDWGYHPYPFPGPW